MAHIYGTIFKCAIVTLCRKMPFFLAMKLVNVSRLYCYKHSPTTTVYLKNAMCIALKSINLRINLGMR